MSREVKYFISAVLACLVGCVFTCWGFWKAYSLPDNSLIILVVMFAAFLLLTIFKWLADLKVVKAGGNNALWIIGLIVGIAMIFTAVIYTMAGWRTDYFEEEDSSSYNYSSYDEEEDDDYSYFSNDYGTSSTICAISGCTNKIASSGDTNCCTYHSNDCLECGCYIDSDAMYCMDCLTSALS